MDSAAELKLRLQATNEGADLERAIASVALCEGLSVEFVDRVEREAANGRLLFGARIRGREVVIVPSDTKDDRILDRLGEALSAWLAVPMAFIWTNDEMDEAITVAHWHGGSRLGPDVEWLDIGSPDLDYRFEFLVPELPLAGAAAEALLRSLEGARTPAFVELGVSFSQPTRRPIGGPLTEALPSTFVKMTALGQTVTLGCDSGPRAEMVAELISKATAALRQFELPAELKERREPVAASTIRAVRTFLPKRARLDSLHRVGFSLSHDQWEARGVDGGVPFELELQLWDVHGHVPNKRLGRELAQAIENLRVERRNAEREALRMRYYVEIRNEEFERAARTYAAFHFPKSKPTRRVLEEARQKIDELAVLLGVRARA